VSVWGRIITVRTVPSLVHFLVQSHHPSTYSSLSRVSITGLNSSAQVVLAGAVGAEYATAYLGWSRDKLGPENVGTMSCWLVTNFASNEGLSIQNAIIHVDFVAGGCNHQPDAQDCAGS